MLNHPLHLLHKKFIIDVWLKHKLVFWDAVCLIITQKFWERLHKRGLENYLFNDNGNENIFKSSLDIFNPKCWIPDIFPGKSPISTETIETLYVCQSQQNCQLLTEVGGCCKYFCIYISPKSINKITSI